MQAPGGDVGIGADQRVGVVGVHLDQVAGADAGEVHLVGVHQEAGAIVADRHREMVGDAFMQIEPRGPAEGGGEVDAFLHMGHVGPGGAEGHGSSFLFVGFAPV